MTFSKNAGSNEFEKEVQSLMMSAFWEEPIFTNNTKLGFDGFLERFQQLEKIKYDPFFSTPENEKILNFSFIDVGLSFFSELNKVFWSAADSSEFVEKTTFNISFRKAEWQWDPCSKSNPIYACLSLPRFKNHENQIDTIRSWFFRSDFNSGDADFLEKRIMEMQEWFFSKEYLLRTMSEAIVRSKVAISGQEAAPNNVFQIARIIAGTEVITSESFILRKEEGWAWEHLISPEHKAYRERFLLEKNLDTKNTSFVGKPRL